MHVLLLDRSGRLIYSNVDPKCSTCLKQCESATEVTTECGVPGRRRRGVLNNEFGTAYLCSNSPDLVASRKRFHTLLQLHAAMLGAYKDARDTISAEAKKEARRVIHNLTSQGAHILQELYALVPQGDLIGGVRGQVSKIAEVLQARPREAAFAYLKTLKNATAMKMEFEIFNKLLFEQDARLLDIRSHQIHRVILNIASVFLAEFQEKGVRLNIDQCEASVDIDYGTFSVAIYHLLHNAVKYTSHNSTVSISFAVGDGVVSVRLAMDSLHIFPHEIPKILEDGYSGEIPRKLAKQGEGLGMAVAHEVIRRHQGSLKVTCGAPRGGLGNAAYSYNTFEIAIPESRRPNASFARPRS